MGGCNNGTRIRPFCHIQRAFFLRELPPLLLRYPDRGNLGTPVAARVSRDLWPYLSAYYR